MKIKNNPLTNSRENQIKFENLSEKLAKHFQKRLSNVLEEKNYRHSQLLLDIKSFWRQMEDINVETEQIIPKMEKYLLDILSRQQNNNNRYDTYDGENTQDTDKTDGAVNPNFLQGRNLVPRNNSKLKMKFIYDF